MVRIKAWWNTFKNVAILLSFIVNFVLIVVLLIVLSLAFQIKDGIAQPLINGLHSSFVGLDQAHIITSINVKDTINVRDTIIVNDTIPVRLNILLQTAPTVVLTKGP